MTAYVIFDVDVRDPSRYQEFMAGVQSALEKAGAKYLARGGAHNGKTDVIKAMGNVKW